MKLTAETWPTDRWRNFSFKEMSCQHCGECDLNEDFMDDLQTMREFVGPMKITSGYRCPEHPIEKAKKAPGSHSKGLAVDVACRGQGAFNVLRAGVEQGMFGIGVSQMGDHRFIHLDQLNAAYRPSVWSY
jgi:zinc D-Ala-D-Ala carboxypeptidase